MAGPQENTGHKVDDLPNGNNAGNILNKRLVGWILVEVIFSVFLVVKLTHEDMRNAILSRSNC